MSATEHPLIFTDPAGRKIAGVLSTPAATTERLVVLCHGFLSHKNSGTNQALTAALLSCGIATFRFDFFGHAESEGPLERVTVTIALEQALAALDLVRGKDFRRLGLIGSSFGGLVALLAAAECGRRHRPLACLGLKCPVADFPEQLELELGLDGMAQWKATDTVPDFRGGPGRIKLDYAFYTDSARHSGYTAAKAITAPTVIVQGDKDELIPLHQCRGLMDALQTDKRLELLPGADHRFTKPEDFERMIRLLAEWMMRYLPPS
jgi:pimeloyl-ACP methyl ester carboxylesterase